MRGPRLVRRFSRSLRSVATSSLALDWLRGVLWRLVCPDAREGRGLRRDRPCSCDPFELTDRRRAVSRGSSIRFRVWLAGYVSVGDQRSDPPGSFQGRPVPSRGIGRPIRRDQSSRGVRAWSYRGKTDIAGHQPRSEGQCGCISHRDNAHPGLAQAAGGIRDPHPKSVVALVG